MTQHGNKKRCVLNRPTLKMPPEPTGSERRENRNTMKYLAIIAIAAAAFSFGACAKDKGYSGSSSTTQSTSQGYSK